jgi:hypothetical protein
MDDDGTSGNATLADLAFGAPKWDLVGPTVYDDIRRVLNRYGKDSVKAAVQQMTKPHRGRPKINDWPELRSVIEADAREWLDGGDPIARRTNYSIAKEFADRNPGQSAVSTHQRIERKLAKKPYDRRWYMLATAEGWTRAEGPWQQHIRVLEALQDHAPQSVWALTLQTANSELADYEAKNGEPPPATLTMDQVKAGARNALALFTRTKPQGLFGQMRAGTE